MHVRSVRYPPRRRTGRTPSNKQGRHLVDALVSRTLSSDAVRPSRAGYTAA